MTLRKLVAQGGGQARGHSLFTSTIPVAEANSCVTKSEGATRLLQRRKQDIHA
jgi:hypothetical protein